jgi:hypothetical protein
MQLINFSESQILIWESRLSDRMASARPRQRHDARWSIHRGGVVLKLTSAGRRIKVIVSGKPQPGSAISPRAPRQQSGPDTHRVEARFVLLADLFGGLPAPGQISFHVGASAKRVADQPITE